MAKIEKRARAIEPLLTVDHSKRGRRFVTVLDPNTDRVTLLEPWEHAVLVLCDGTRDAAQIAELLVAGVEGEAVTQRSAERCLKYFERQQLIENVGFRREGADRATGPRTLAGIQQAYREWHKDPVKTGQILAGHNGPFPMLADHIPVGLEPTVALPDDNEKESSPVAIGTTLVLGDADDSFDDGRALRSVLDDAGVDTDDARAAEPKTQIGSLTGDDEETAEEEIELGNVAELLAMVDDDFREQEEASAKSVEPAAHVPPPVGKAMGGVAEVPKLPDVRSASVNIKMAPTAELSDVETRAEEPPVERTEQIRRSALHKAATPERMLNPTMVGLPPEDGQDGPVIISPPRRSSSLTGERIGAVVGPEPSRSEPPVGRKPKPRSNSGIHAGAVVEVTQQIETPTDGAYGAMAPEVVDTREAPATEVSEVSAHEATFSPVVIDDSTTSQTTAHVHERARAVFERLRRIGLKARTYGDESWDGETAVPRDARKRRRHEAESREFEQALETLTAGDLEVALTHFRNLHSKLPNSERVAKFVEAIEAADPALDEDGGEATRRILFSFEDALEGAMEAGRCPQCFTTLENAEQACPGCGFSNQQAGR